MLFKKNLELVFYCCSLKQNQFPSALHKTSVHPEGRFQYFQEKQTQVSEVYEEIPSKYSNPIFSVCILPLSEAEGQNHLLGVELPGAQCMCSCRFRHDGAVQQHKVSWGCCLVSGFSPTRSGGVDSPRRELSLRVLRLSLELWALTRWHEGGWHTSCYQRPSPP